MTESLESDADFRERLLLFLGEANIVASRRGVALNPYEWSAALTVTGEDLDRLAGVRGLVRHGRQEIAPLR